MLLLLLLLPLVACKPFSPSFWHAALAVHLLLLLQLPPQLAVSEPCVSCQLSKVPLLCLMQVPSCPARPVALQQHGVMMWLPLRRRLLLLLLAGPGDLACCGSELLLLPADSCWKR
jgi:hypothetical protein